MAQKAGQDWSAEGYARHARFVADLGAPVLALLDPRAGERILDLGCGDGALTEEIRDAGAMVVGLDASPDLLDAARARGLEVVEGDAQDLRFEANFDAVFSNAALHWMTRPAAVVEGVTRALKPGGRFVAEMGGFSNVAAISTALRVALCNEGIDGLSVQPWHFPSPPVHRELLERHGFTVDLIELIPRPTPLPTGMEGWIATFGMPFLRHLPVQRRDAAAAHAVEILRPALCDEAGNWIADYVRLRFRAVLRI